MPRNVEKSKGPPENVIDKLVGIHEANGTLDNLLNSGIGEQLVASQTAALAGRTAAYGVEPWSFDGSELTMLGDINSGTGDSNPQRFTKVGETLYFIAYNGLTSELYMIQSDGTGPTKIDVTAGNSAPQLLFSFDGALYYTSRTDTDDGFGQELHRLEEGSTTPVEIDINLNPGGSSNPASFVVFNNALYFQAYDGTSGEIYKLEAGSTTPILVDITPSSGTAFSRPFVFDGSLFFGGTPTGTSDVELIRLEADDVTFTEFDLNPSGSSYPQNPFIFNDSLYFSANDGDSYKLFKLDAGSTSPVNLGIESFGQMVEFDNALYYVGAETPGSTETRVFRLDAGSTTPVSIDETYPGGNDFIGSFVVFDGALYYSANDETGERELFKLSAGSTTPDEFDFLSSGASFAQALGVVNDTLAIGARIDEDGDGIFDRYALLTATNDPQSTGDFVVIDDGSDTFEVAGQLAVFETGDFLF